MDLLGEELDSSNWVEDIRSVAGISLRGLEVTGIVEPACITCQVASATGGKDKRNRAKGRSSELKIVSASSELLFYLCRFAVYFFPLRFASCFLGAGAPENSAGVEYGGA